jgi:hypothetical protein
MSYDYNDNAKVYYSGKYWNDYPECLSIINTRLFGKDINWTDFLLKNNLKFNNALILNSGNGWVERDLYDKGIIKSADCVEYNQDLINESNTKKEDRNLNYIQHDINTVEFESEKFDLVLNFAAGHHIRYIEKVFINIRKWMKLDAYFIHNDYIGPQRNQYTKQQWLNMNNMNNTLSIKFRKQLGYPDVIQMMIDDPTEAINPQRIIPLLNDLFNIEYHTKSGGSLAYEILTHNDKLFNSNVEERTEIVNYLMKKDEEYMNKTGESFFHFIMCRKNIELDEDIINKNINMMNNREKLADKSYGHYCYNLLNHNDLILCNEHNSYGKSFFVHGFSQIESNGRWSIGDKSIIRFKYNSKGNDKLIIKCNTLPNYVLKVNIEINEINNIALKIQTEETIEIPLINNSNEALIVFNYENSITPKDLNINDDTRKLALFFKSMKIS